MDKTKYWFGVINKVYINECNPENSYKEIDMFEELINFKDIKYILVGKNDYENQGQIIKFIIVFNQDINIFDCILFNDWKNLLDFNDSNFTLREPCINNDNFLIQFIGLKNKYSFDIIKRMILKMNIKYSNTDVETINIIDD